MTEVAPSIRAGTGSSGQILRPIAFSDIPGWAGDDHAAAFAAFRSGASAMMAGASKARGLGISGAGLRRIAREALALSGSQQDGARKFFERWFSPQRIEAHGFVTAYYEPEVDASREPTTRFSVPLFRRPPDLVEVDDGNRPAGWDAEMRFAREALGGLTPYHDRAAIEDGALAGRDLELAYVESPVDAFFIHVQGSARLRLVDGPERGSTLRIGFDGKTGHPYMSIGRLAVERGRLARDRADKDGLEAWLRGHPEEGRALMRENRSFIFFRETEAKETEGPVGAAGVPLMTFRSLAIDRTLHTFHTPIFVEVPDLPDPERKTETFRRLMIGHDTGSAITGPARGDLFFGSGPDAGSAAGRVRHAATMIVLAPNEDAASR